MTMMYHTITSMQINQF